MLFCLWIREKTAVCYTFSGHENAAASIICPVAEVKMTLGYTFVARRMPQHNLLHGPGENDPWLYICGQANSASVFAPWPG
ncbi:unnamed protein product [Ixodes pacificus]